MPYMTEEETALQRDRVAAGLLPHLTHGPWDWQPVHSHYGAAHRSDGMSLIMSLDVYTKRARFRVEGPARQMGYGRGLRDYGAVPYAEPEPACTVAWDRPGRLIAAEIHRKVLAVAIPLWPLVLAKAEEEAQQFAQRDATAAHLARLTNAGVAGERRGDTRSVCATVGGVWLSMDVGPGGCVTLPRMSLTGRQAEALIMALRSCGMED